MGQPQQGERVSASLKGTLKLFHLIGTAWFILCVGFILIASLRQAGFKWWVIFSLSGQSMVVLFALLSLYLLAIQRGTGRAESFGVEHPLTNNDYYMTFYMSAPFLGGIIGCVNGILDAPDMAQFVYGVTLGTFGTTFVVWAVADPLCGLFETFTPVSRKNRMERLARQRAEREEKQSNREALLLALEKQERENHRQWNVVLPPYADELAALLSVDELGLERAQRRAAELGLIAWQTGGLGCMRYLHEMALSSVSKQNTTDYIAWWWDGIGTWRNDPVMGSL
jgi:hypothetical protein